jgi:hypothetical protein
MMVVVVVVMVKVIAVAVMVLAVVMVVVLVVLLQVAVMVMASYRGGIIGRGDGTYHDVYDQGTDDADGGGGEKQRPQGRQFGKRAVHFHHHSVGFHRPPPVP